MSSAFNPFRIVVHEEVLVPSSVQQIDHYQSILARCHRDVGLCPITFEPIAYDQSVAYFRHTVLFLLRNSEGIRSEYPDDYPCIPMWVDQWIRHIVPFIIWGHPLSEVSPLLTVSSQNGPTDADTARWYDTCQIKVPSGREEDVFY